MQITFLDSFHVCEHHLSLIEFKNYSFVVCLSCNVVLNSFEGVSTLD